MYVNMQKDFIHDGRTAVTIIVTADNGLPAVVDHCNIFLLHVLCIFKLLSYKYGYTCKYYTKPNQAFCLRVCTAPN